ncbi:hypothetical protein CRUP_001419 [Coryphaenoides rupestris]|nr:hypothetical protein CRUP_001419 [Coryphaenoides rupestris]
MNPPCGRCSKAVYPTEKINCLDKFWHRSCFSCEVCKMALSMNNYKGFGKKPYCSMHYPKSSYTMVTDTPENLRLKQQSMLNSQALYKEDFERSRGRGFSVVTDTPEMQRVKKTQDLISNIKYHEEFEKSKVGDVILEPQPIDQGWMFGLNQRTGQRGMLPANYVKLI